MAMQQFNNPAVSAFVSGVELADSLPRLPMQTAPTENRVLGRRISGFLLQSIGNLDVKKRGGRNSRRYKRKIN